jgi:hypothetical protein
MRSLGDGLVGFDDFKKDAISNNRSFNYSRHFRALLDALREGRTCVLSDIDFCRNEARIEAERFIRRFDASVSIEWRFFACDIPRCKANVIARARVERQRNVVRELQNIDAFAASYEIPPGSFVLPVQD